ncbi:(5-formylfuran-3-yl)methyl phosphate synthase [Methylobacillus gramineus]|uniref:(5-formylfuran-3-yl)methyl phosphate synthase n=1 Tax=Methylobacillus gramineus TaxID=755169 RepID=UPI001CFF9342|nr:(5-formylfuran-3-yl)methyl phosphate synthase [Methylobacillus gramineus]MCB5184188.1 (5-formylfuran-3-yl)methyl phosphate synthase [Methylobacillus gramineus]
MIKLLVSVTNVEEALQALEAGADIIDLKNPLEGALGALPLSVIEQAVLAIDGRRITSATTGDLPMEPELILDAVKAVAACGVDIVKVGFFGTALQHEACIAALKPLISQQSISIVAVLMADLSPDLAVVHQLRQAGFFGVMLDTARKNGSHLLSHMSMHQLQDFVESAHGLQTGLAGSLRIENIKQLNKLKPSYIGVRGAVCEDFNRVAKLSKTQVSAIKLVLYNNNTYAENADLV